LIISGNIAHDSADSTRFLVLRYLKILTLALGFSMLFHNTWVKYLDIYHTILELTSIFMAFAIFISVWYTHGETSMTCHALGFGYLAVAIFDALHTLYFLKLDLAQNAYFDLSTRYWILGRLAEAIVLVACLYFSKTMLSKWTSLSVTLILAGGISYFVNVYHDYLPVLLTSDGVTPVKTVLEYMIIALLMGSLYILKYKKNHGDTISRPYIVLSILLTISSEFCFTFYTSVTSVAWTGGHILKVISYFFLFKGIFVSTVTYPYRRLANEHKNLEEILDTLPIAVQKYDNEGKLKYVNKKFEELLSCHRRDLYGLTPQELSVIFPSIEVGEKKPISPNSKGKEKARHPIRSYKNLRGEHIKLSLSLHKVSSGTLALFSDVSQEQRLENLHIQTNTILNSVNNCILMIDKDKKIVLCNTWFSYNIYKP